METNAEPPGARDRREDGPMPGGKKITDEQQDGEQGQISQALSGDCRRTSRSICQHRRSPT